MCPASGREDDKVYETVSGIVALHWCEYKFQSPNENYNENQHPAQEMNILISG